MRLNLGSKFLRARYAQHLLYVASIATDFTCVYYTAAGTVFGTTDVYELGFSYLSICIFRYLTYLAMQMSGSILLHFLLCM